MIYTVYIMFLLGMAIMDSSVLVKVLERERESYYKELFHVIMEAEKSQDL